MRKLYDVIQKFFVTDELLKAISGKDKDFTKNKLRHFGVLTSHETFYTFTHTHYNQKIELNQQTITLQRIPISFEKNLRGENKPQFMTGPGYNFKNYLDYKLIEVFRHQNADDFEKMDKFFKEYEYQIFKTIEYLNKNDGVIFVKHDNMLGLERDIKKIHLIDKLD